jgi:creatinine amidohydrolase
MCIDLAKRTGGIVLPPVYQASSTIKTYPGVDFKKHSLEFSEELFKMLCTEYFEQLVDEGFKIIVLLTGHAGEPHFEILKSVAHTFNQRFADRHFWALAEFDVLSSDLLVANHSAIGETSLQLHYAPEMVAMDRLPQDREITLVKDGVSGDDPRPATKEFGAKIVEAFVENAGAKMDALIEQYL